MQVTGNTPITAPEIRIFYPALDGLRTVAFMLVFLQHFDQLPWGWCGVNFFFVLSGFLITGILFDTRDDAHRARKFYTRRTLRIFPLYYALMLLLLLFWPIARWQWDWRWLAWPAYLGNFLHFTRAPPGSLAQRAGDFQTLGYFHGHQIVLFCGHFWSLCIEEQFYLVWPWVVFSIRDRRKLLWLCGLALPVGLLLRLVAQHSLPSWMVGQNVLSRFTPLSCDALLFGGLLALALRGAAKDHIFKYATWAFPPYLLLCLACAFLRQSQRHWILVYPYPTWVETFGFTIVDILGALLLLNALQPGNWVYRLLALRPLRWAGRISYGAYIFHDIPHVFFSRMADHFPHHHRTIMSLLALTFTYLAAWLSFRFLESPFLDLKERWTGRSPLPTAPEKQPAS